MDAVDVRLNKFLAEFLDDAVSWTQATNELPDMYLWLMRVHNLLLLRDNDPLTPVGRDNCLTPSAWNRKYKEAIRIAFGRLDDNLVERFAQNFTEWLSGDDFAAATGEWVTVNEEWESFRKRWGYGKLPVGMQFEVDNEVYLVGDTNELGGSCDHCRSFDRTSVVARFRTLPSAQKQSHTTTGDQR